MSTWPVNIRGASGGFNDRVAAISRLAADLDVDTIVGDWLSEHVMTGVVRSWKAAQLAVKLSPSAERKKTPQYASTFLQRLEPALSLLAQTNIKLAVNASASDTELLAEVGVDMGRSKGLNLKAAWVGRDEVTQESKKSVSQGVEFRSLTDGKSLQDLGIAEALPGGAGIVTCGHVADAAPTIGALIARHIIECSAFGTEKKHLSLGFPIAAVYGDGTFVILKEKGTGGVVNIETVTSQLVYEISGAIARYATGEDLIKELSMLKFPVHGTSPDNPRNQDIATVDFRIFAQARDKELFDFSFPYGFSRKLFETVPQSCPGVSQPNDLRQSMAKSYWENFVTLIPQSAWNHRVHFLFDRKGSIGISLPPTMKEYETVDVPLGYVDLGRSRDKASDANVGLFVSTKEEWDWLRSMLSIENMKELLGEEYTGGRIDRFEM
ncbi:hypothetical protein F5Y16DRAFT_414737 [Xylariaceae sp. FL0255]|nr:hypothetical protein F5Y16DRAFT_414737 [Xylariaceae sp. FL0255]